MSSLRASDKSKLERLFEMSQGYVLSFSDASFGEFFGDFNIDIHSEKALKELNLIPDGIDEKRRGCDTIKNLLRSLGTIGRDLGELRNLYGTGHGKTGKATGLQPRHAKLAVGAAATFTTFLFETHLETRP